MKKFFSILYFLPVVCLGATDENVYYYNSLERCKVHSSSEERYACYARMMGFGNRRGSVKEGGILYEVETIILSEKQRAIQFIPKTTDPVIIIPSN